MIELTKLMKLAQLHHGDWYYSDDFAACQGGYHVPSRYCNWTGAHLLTRCHKRHQVLDGQDCPVFRMGCPSGTELQVRNDYGDFVRLSRTWQE